VGGWDDVYCLDAFVDSNAGHLPVTHLLHDSSDSLLPMLHTTITADAFSYCVDARQPAIRNVLSSTVWHMTYIFCVQVQLVEYRLTGAIVQKEFHYHIGIWYVNLLYVELCTYCLRAGR
jgi:hypothetical protein